MTKYKYSRKEIYDFISDNTGWDVGSYTRHMLLAPAEPKEKCSCIDRKSNPMIVDTDCPKHHKDTPKLPEKLDMAFYKTKVKGGRAVAIEIMVENKINEIINYLQQKEK